MTDPSLIALQEIWFLDVFQDFHAFIAMAVSTFAIIGTLASRSMAVGALSGYLLFTIYASRAGDQLLLNVLYVTMVLVIVGMAFKLWRAEGGGRE